MAGIIEGLFTDPNSFRNERLDNLMNLQARQSQMGGSYSDLLGQIAAQGNIMGQMGAEAAAGMFGMSTPEEAKAAELQAMSQNYDLQSPEGVAEFAKSLNGLGYTKEAITMMDRFRTLKQDKDRELDRQRAEEDRQREIDQGKFQTVYEERPVVMTDSKGNPIIGPNNLPMMTTETVRVTYKYDDDLRDYVKVEGSEGAQGGSDYLAPWEKLLKGGSDESTEIQSASTGTTPRQRTRPAPPSSTAGAPTGRTVTRPTRGQ